MKRNYIFLVLEIWISKHIVNTESTGMRWNISLMAMAIKFFVVWVLPTLIFGKSDFFFTNYISSNMIFIQITIKYIKKQKFGAFAIVESQSKVMWSVSYVTCADIIAKASLTRWWRFLFLDVPTLKLRIVIILANTWPHQNNSPDSLNNKKLSCQDWN